MKKLVALMLAVSMLVFAGCAFAASDTTGHGGGGGGTVTPPPAATTTVVVQQVVSKVVETVQVVTKVVSAAAQESAVVETFAQVTRTVTQTLSVTTLTAVKGMDTETATKWAAKAEEVQQATTTVVSTITSNIAQAIQVFNFTTTTTTITVEALTPKTNDLLEPVAVASVASTASAAEKLAAASDRLGEGKVALSAPDPVQPRESGTYSFPKTFGRDFYGTKIGGNRGRRGTSASAASVRASAEDDEEGVAFVDSAGNVTEVIPGDDDPDIMPGFVTMLVVMEAGEIYEPTVYATDEALEEAGVATEDQEVQVNVIESTVETVIKTVDADGNTVGEAQVVEEADNTVLTAMASAVGMQAADLKNAYLVQGVEFPEYADAMATAQTYADANDYFIATKEIAAMSGLPAGTYYVQGVTIATSARDFVDNAAFEFYPNGFNNGTATVAVFDKDGTELTPETAEGKNDTYVVFEVSGNMAAPVLAVKLKEAATPGGGTGEPGGGTGEPGGGTGEPGGGTGEPGGGTEEPFNDPGSSGGGCDAGFSALALAVLGAFIARKK